LGGADQTAGLPVTVRRLVLLLFAPLSLCAAAAGADVPDSLRDRWAAGIRQLMGRNGIPAMAVALVDRDRIIWSQGFGSSADHGSRTVDGNTVFSIQSVSKSVTATAVLLAVQDGLVDLDAPVTRYLPDFTVNSCFEKHPESKITLRLLLTHAAGLTHEPPVGNNYDCPFPSYEAHNWSIRDTWLNSPVGTRYSYSNNGYDLATEAVARASGMAFPEFVRQRLFAPLGMSSTTLDAATAMRSGCREYRMLGRSPAPETSLPAPMTWPVLCSST
jgi:CubicO group peptidase (beta-lactamase class C family)